MADATALLDQISQSAAQKEVPANAALLAAWPAMMFAKRDSQSSGLTWGVYGGRLNGASVGNTTLTLTASATNYIVVHRTTLAASVATTTTNWNNTATYGRAYQVTVGTSGPTDWNDVRKATDGTGILDTPVMVGDSGSGGVKGLVPAAAAGDAAAGKFLKADGTFAVPSGAAGTVTATGSPVSGNLTKFSGAASITSGDLSGDVTTSGTLTTTLVASGVTAAVYGDGEHAAQITFDAKGRATTAVNKPLFNWFNVKDYGALGDGSTDDTTAIQAAINACNTAGGGVVYFPLGVYIVGGALQDTGGANAQLTLPTLSLTADAFITIEFRGVYTPPAKPRVTTTVGLVVPTGGSTIKSTLGSGTGALLGIYNAGSFSNVRFVSRNMRYRMPSNPTNSCLDLRWAAQVDIDQSEVDTGAYKIRDMSVPTTSTSYALRTPSNGNGALTRVGQIVIVGMYNGIEVSEHAFVENPHISGCAQALVFPAADHGSYVARALVNWCKKALVFTGGNHYTKISELDIEHGDASPWTPTNDVDDSSNFGHGEVYWTVVLAETGQDSTFTKSGGSNLITRRIGTAAAAAGSSTQIQYNSSGVLAGDSRLTFDSTNKVAKGQFTVDSSGVNAQTGTTYTLAATDNGAVVTLNNASAITLTVPSGLGAGFSCIIIQKGAGQVTVSASSTTINSSNGLKLAAQYAAASLIAVAADTFNLSGNTTT